MATLMRNQDKLENENVLMHGLLEGLMALKDKMLVSVPVLQAELRGLRNGMELERMKAEVAVLQANIANTHACLSQVQLCGSSSSSSSDINSSDSSSSAEATEEDAAPLMFNLPRSSMFVHPSQLRESRRATPLVQAAVVTEEATTATGSPMAIA